MEAGAEEIVAVRQEMLRLLRQQVDALDSPQGLTDARLAECYERQARVHALREKLQSLSDMELEAESKPEQPSETVSCGARS